MREKTTVLKLGSSDEKPHTRGIRKKKRSRSKRQRLPETQEPTPCGARTEPNQTKPIQTKPFIFPTLLYWMHGGGRTRALVWICWLVMRIPNCSQLLFISSDEQQPHGIAKHPRVATHLSGEQFKGGHVIYHGIERKGENRTKERNPGDGREYPGSFHLMWCGQRCRLEGQVWNRSTILLLALPLPLPFPAIKHVV